MADHATPRGHHGGLNEGSVLVLLTIAMTHPPATDLGYLLHNLDRVRTFEISFGTVCLAWRAATPVGRAKRPIPVSRWART
jgi:hypothetical protein